MNENIKAAILSVYDRSPLSNDLIGTIVRAFPEGFIENAARRKFVLEALDVATSTERCLTISNACTRQDWLVLIKLLPITKGWGNDDLEAARAFSVIAAHTHLHRQLSAVGRLSAGLIYPSERLLILLHDRPEAVGWIMMLVSFTAMGLGSQVQEYLIDTLKENLKQARGNLGWESIIGLLVTAESLAKELYAGMASVRLAVDEIFDSDVDLDLDPRNCDHGRTKSQDYVKASELLCNLKIFDQPLKLPQTSDMKRRYESLISGEEESTLQFDTTTERRKHEQAHSNAAYSNRSDGKPFPRTFSVGKMDLIEHVRRCGEQALSDCCWSNAAIESMGTARNVLSSTVILSLNRERLLAMSQPAPLDVGGISLLEATSLDPSPWQSLSTQLVLDYDDMHEDPVLKIEKWCPRLPPQCKRRSFIAAVSFQVAYHILKHAISGRPPRTSTCRGALQHALNITEAAVDLAQGSNINQMTMALGLLYTGEWKEFFDDVDSPLITAIQGEGSILMLADPCLRPDYIRDRGLLKYFILDGAFRATRASTTFTFGSDRFRTEAQDMGEYSAAILAPPANVSVNVLIQASGDNILLGVLGEGTDYFSDYGYFCFSALMAQRGLDSCQNTGHDKGAIFVSGADVINYFGSDLMKVEPTFCGTAADPVLQMLALSIGTGGSTLHTEKALQSSLDSAAYSLYFGSRVTSTRSLLVFNLTTD